MTNAIRNAGIFSIPTADYFVKRNFSKALL
jgi:hypothetical protein